MLPLILSSLMLPLISQFLWLLVTPGPISYWLLFLLFSGTIYFYFPVRKSNIFQEAVVLLITFVLLFVFANQWLQFYPTGEHVRDYNLLSSSINNPLNPIDPWLSGYANAYYIYWFKWGASLAHMFGLTTSQAYSVCVSLSYSFYVTLLFILFSRILSLSAWRSLMATFVVAFGSNLDGIHFYFRSSTNWWEPSRVISGIINEFPWWSFFQTDFHPHFADLSLSVLYIIISFYSLRLVQTRYGKLVFLGMAYGIFYRLFMLANPWEVIFLSLAFPGFILKEIFFEEDPVYDLTKTQTLIALGLGAITLCATFVYPPRYVSGVNLKLVTDAVGRSPVKELFLHWGWWWILALVSIVLIAFQKKLKEITSKEAYFLVLAFLMLILPEIVYVNDSYGPPYERMNFMFKHYMPTWTMTGIAVMYLFHKHVQGKIYFLTVVLMIVVSSLFTLKTLPIKWREFAHMQTKLDLADRDLPGIKATVEKLRALPRGVIVQSSLRPYDYTSFLGSLADKDVYLGWINHLLVLNIDYGEMLGRQELIKNIYTQLECEKKILFFKQTKAQYLALSLQEQRDFPQANQTDFSCFKIVVHEGNNFVFTLN